MTDEGERVVPRSECEKFADEDPVLAAMLRRGIPLTRNAYLMLAHGGDLPEEWTAEHEADVPACFRSSHAVKRDPGKRRHVHID